MKAREKYGPEKSERRQKKPDGRKRRKSKSKYNSTSHENKVERFADETLKKFNKHNYRNTNEGKKGNERA